MGSTLIGFLRLNLGKLSSTFHRHLLLNTHFRKKVSTFLPLLSSGISLRRWPLHCRRTQPLWFIPSTWLTTLSTTKVAASRLTACRLLWLPLFSHKRRWSNLRSLSATAHYCAGWWDLLCACVCARTCVCVCVFCCLLRSNCSGSLSHYFPEARAPTDALHTTRLSPATAFVPVTVKLTNQSWNYRNNNIIACFFCRLHTPLSKMPAESLKAEEMGWRCSAIHF